MPAIPLLSGVVGGPQGEFRESYPLNLEPVAVDTRISRGQVRATSGAVAIGTGPGADRGGIAWNGVCYRVMGTKLVSVAPTGTVTTIGDVGGSGPARMDYSFDRLGIRSGTAFWQWDGTTLAQITDADLGQVVDLIWIDGFWMTTDGMSVVVTELGDPTSVNPLKYGSSEEDPDPVTGLMKVRNEAHVVNRHTIQVFRNVGGNGFPFQTVRGATIPFGCVSATAKCYFASTFAFVGSARDEALRVYVAGQGSAAAISTRAIEDILAAEVDPAAITMESRVGRGEQRLIIHLAGQSLVYLGEASAKVQQPVWYRLQSGAGDPYRIRGAVPCYGTVIVGDASSSAVGTLSDDTDLHFGEAAAWQLDAGLIYNDGAAAIAHSFELVGLPGRGPDSSIALSLTRDGETYSAPGTLQVPAARRRARLQWRPHAKLENYMGLRFTGRGGMPGFTRLEAELEPLG